jgi:hypothetical protein
MEGCEKPIAFKKNIYLGLTCIPRISEPVRPS